MATSTGLVDTILDQVECSIRNSGRNYFWKWRARTLVKQIFRNGTIDIDKLVDYLMADQRRQSPKKICNATVEHKTLLMKALFGTVLERVDEKLISEDLLVKLLYDRWGGDYFERMQRAERRYREEYGRDPPGYVLISPGKHCNLKCGGCYASSTERTRDRLDYEIVKRIVRESHEQWGSHLVAISGGEPFMYRSNGKGLLDLAREFPYMYFIVYTNGTLISKDMAEKLAAVANVTPAISIEGSREDTDNRRGDGVYDKVMAAMANLRQAGVPFGVSITATRNNIATLLTESFYDYLFEQLKVSYGWIFEYMPIGRGAETRLMPSPVQRRQLFELLDKQNCSGRFICDFWSTSPSAEGCIAAGRSSGYMYISWNGELVPCVFNPFTDTNIVEVYRRGGDLTDAVENSHLFKSLREWQHDYGFRKGEKTGNLMTPCPIRDHYREYRNLLTETRASPLDDAAAVSMTDQDYYDRMVSYGGQVEIQLKDIWEQRFCGHC